MSVDQGAVLQLDPGGGKLEHTVIYVSNDWQNLSTLLSQPKATVSGYRARFGGTAPTFTLNEPVRVLMQGATRLADIQMIAGAFNVPAPKNAGIAAIQTLMSQLPRGGYIVEFAIDTHIVCIRYLPPSTPPAPLFNEPVTPQTFLMATDNKGNLHFDIEGTNITTSHFAVDYIVDRAALVGRCLVTGQYSEDITGNRLVDVGTVLNPVIGTSSPVRTFTGNANELPTVVIENMTGDAGMDPVGCVCVDIDVTKDDATGNYDLGTLVLKIYEGPCPPPPSPPAGGGGSGDGG